MRRLIINALIIFSLAALAAAAASLHEAAAYLKAGEGEKAAAELTAYGRGEPTAPLANQALDGVLLLYKKKLEPQTLAPYVEALALLADGYAATADAVFREMAADEALPWPLRGRAVLLAADMNTAGDRLRLLEEAWRECDDDTGRLLAVALAEAYYQAGRVEEARAVRDEFARRFPGDEGIKYFDYLAEEESD
jgi:outer membrane protein assembly factor BamD (BamD/ComL family)